MYCHNYAPSCTHVGLFGPKKDDNMEWRWIGHVARMEEGRNVFKILTGKPTGRRSLGRSWIRWEDNIRMDLKEIRMNTKNWIDSAQNRDY